MTFAQLPEEDQKKIKKIFEEGEEYQRQEYLLDIYYYNIAPVSDPQKERDFAVGCNNCILKMLRYFRRNLK